MFLIYKKKGYLVAISFCLAVIIVAVNHKKLPYCDHYFFPFYLFVTAILNFLFTVLFVRNEENRIEDEFKMILAQQKERFPKKNFSDFNTKLMQIKRNQYSSLYFIRNKNWTYIFLALAVILFALFSLF